MQYTVNQEFTQITEKEGVMQNLSVHAVEVITSKTVPDKTAAGLVLSNSEKISFKTDDNIYIRCTQPKVTAMLAIVNFNAYGGAGSDNGTGGNEGNGDSGGGSGIAGNTYKQVTKLGVTAPAQVQIPMSTTDTFCLPPVEILKFTAKAGDNAVVVKNNVAQFKQNETYTFSDAVKLKTAYTIPTQTVAVGDGFLSESGEFDFKKIEKVEVN